MRIRWLGRASRDLDRIEAYIARDDPRAAVRTVLRIIEAVDQLAWPITLPSEGQDG